MDAFTIIETHLAFNHAPFFTILFGVLFLIYGTVKKENLLLRIGFIFVLASAFISAFVFLSGEMAHDTVARFADVRHTDIELHETAAKYLLIVMATLGLLMVFGHFKFGSEKIPSWFTGTAIIISLSALFLLVNAQKLGGAIRHPEVRDDIDRSKLLVKEEHHHGSGHDHDHAGHNNASEHDHDHIESVDRPADTQEMQHNYADHDHVEHNDANGHNHDHIESVDRPADTQEMQHNHADHDHDHAGHDHAGHQH